MGTSPNQTKADMRRLPTALNPKPVTITGTRAAAGGTVDALRGDGPSMPNVTTT